MVQPPDAETQQGKVFLGKLLPLVGRDGKGQGKAAVEELLPEGIQAIERQENLHLLFLGWLFIIKAGMVEDGEQFIVHGIVSSQVLILLPSGDVLLLPLLETFAVWLAEKDMHLLSPAVRSGESAAAQRIGAAGAGAVCIDPAAGGGYKRAAGPAVIQHPEENPGKTAALFLLNKRILVEKGRGGKPQLFAQPEDIVGAEGQFQLPAAVVKAGNAGMASEPESLVRGQGADMFWGKIGAHA